MNNTTWNNHERYRTGEKALTFQQVDKLKLTIDNLQDRVMFLLGVSNGIRREDMAELRWENVDLAQRMISYTEHKKKRIHTTPIPSSETITSLTMLKNISKSDFIFPAERKGKNVTGHASGKTLYNRFHVQLAKAGIDKKPFHCLRATCVKQCQRNGWSAEQTAKLIGDSIRVVQEHYSTPSIEEMKEVAKEKQIV